MILQMIFSRGILYGYSTDKRDLSVLLKFTTRLPLLFRRNSRVISGPAISPPRLLSFDYKFRNEISYSLRDPFIRHSNDVFLRSRVVPAQKHVNTYGVPRALHTDHFVWRCSPAVLPHLTRTSRCRERRFFFPRSLLTGFTERRYALLRRPALREAFGNISSPA